MEQVIGEPGQPPSILRFQELVHVGGIAADVQHPQVLADGVDVAVGRVVEIVDRRGQGGAVPAGQFLRRSPLEEQLDEPLVLRRHQADIHRKGPQDEIGPPHVVQNLPERAVLFFKAPDLPGHVVDLEIVPGELPGDEMHVLHGDADVTLGTPVQDRDMHDRLPSFPAMRDSNRYV